MPRVRPLHPLPRRAQAPPPSDRPDQGRPTHRLPGHDRRRRQAWGIRSPEEVLALYPVGSTPALQVVDVLIELYNTRHTAIEKTVSHKTRHERAQFLRRFFRDLKSEAGYRVVPDPRSLGQRHLHDMVQVWRHRRLAPATIQTYLSFLRGLAMWVGKPGLVLQPAQYGLAPDEYERHENAQHDRSWRAHGIDVDAMLAQVTAFDARVGASMRLMVAFGLRRKESVMRRPHAHVHPFAETGLPDHLKEADQYLWTKGKGGRVRWLPAITEGQQAAIAQARSVALGFDAHLGDPDRDLKANLRRLDYMLARFGLTKRAIGTTGHGARHGFLQDTYRADTGQLPPVCGGARVEPDADRAARLRVAERAGHSRLRAAGPYIGGRRATQDRPVDEIRSRDAGGPTGGRNPSGSVTGTTAGDAADDAIRPPDRR